MIKRVVEISNQAHISVKDFQLTIKNENWVFTIPLEDIGVIVLESSAITISHRLLIEVAHKEITLLVCDERHHPVWLYHALSWHTQSAKYLKEQVNVSPIIQKKLWQLIIQKKIYYQSQILKKLWKEYLWIYNISHTVKSGDSDNREGYAANLYWKELLWKNHTRKYENLINTMLNYGYALVRASIARWVVSSWLHPSLGIFHNNQFNAFNLVDDLIEPFRPLLDLRVYEIIENHMLDIEEQTLTPTIKRLLLEILTLDIYFDGKKLPINIAIEYYTSSFRDSLSNYKNFIIPQIFDEL